MWEAPWGRQHRERRGISHFAGTGRARKRRKPKPRPRCAVRLGRIAKACRRARRARVVEAKRKRRLLASGILPAGVYGAEHAPWHDREVHLLANEAVRVAGLNVMGVLFHVLRLLVPAEARPEWKICWSALDR